MGCYQIALTNSKEGRIFAFRCGSARFASLWVDNRLEIYAYAYVHGSRQEAFLGVVDLNQFNRYRLSIHDEYYPFQLNNGEAVKMSRGNICTRGIYHKLWPYFGGSVAAPHDIRIVVKGIY